MIIRLIVEVLQLQDLIIIINNRLFLRINLFEKVRFQHFLLIRTHIFKEACGLLILLRVIGKVVAIYIQLLSTHLSVQSVLIR